MEREGLKRKNPRIWPVASLDQVHEMQIVLSRLLVNMFFHVLIAVLYSFSAGVGVSVSIIPIDHLHTYHSAIFYGLFCRPIAYILGRMIYIVMNISLFKNLVDTLSVGA